MTKRQLAKDTAPLPADREYQAEGWTDPTWEAEQDVPDPDPASNPIPREVLDFEGAKQAWRHNKIWDEAERELKIPRQIGDRVYIRDGAGAMEWLRAVVTGLPPAKPGDANAEAEYASVVLEEGPREGEEVTVRDADAFLRCWSTTTLAPDVKGNAPHHYFVKGGRLRYT